MISNGLTKLIFYSKQKNGSYTLSSIYDICIGTFYSELGLNKQKYVDISSFIKNSNKEILVKKNVLSINYELPRTIISDLHDLLLDCNTDVIEQDMCILSPIIVFIDENFKYDIINEYINSNKEYGTKEYKLK